MDENVKRISFYIFLSLVFIFIIYMVFLRPSNTNNKQKPKSDPCAHCPDPKSCNVHTGECGGADMCEVPEDSKRDSCRLLVGILTGDDIKNESENYLNPLVVNDNYMTADVPFLFFFKNTDGFNGIVFSTKPIGGDIWNIDNYKINTLILTSVNIRDKTNTIETISIPGTIRSIPGDDAKAISYYIPIKNVLENRYFIMARWEGSGKSKIKLYVYLTMETSPGNWQ